MSYENIRVTIDPPLGWIRMHRAERLNALDAGLCNDLTAAVEDLNRTEGVRVILLCGDGRAFSSGGDLREIAARLIDSGEKRFLGDLVDAVHRTIRAVIDSARPVVAAIHGVAAGAGLSLALACDLRIAAADARFQMSFINIGLVADSGSTWLLPRLVGMGKAVELALTGEAVGAAEMERCGALTRVVPEAELFDRAAELGHRLARKSERALARTKQLLREGWGRSLEDQLDAERAGILAVVEESDDFVRAIRSFLERSKGERSDR